MPYRLAEWRKALFLDPSPEDQTAVREALAGGGVEAVLLCIEAFAWVFEPRDKSNPYGKGAGKALPFLLWPYQEAAVREIYDAIENGHDILIDKSRDMGATWIVEAVLWSLWLTQPNRTFSLVSRKEDLVDTKGDPDCLFWKLDHLNKHLPPWIRPKIERNALHLANLDNGSTIDGESTNADAGRGGRRDAILLDEAASIENLKDVLSATADNTPCRILVSTPKGTGSFDDSGNLHGNCFGAVRFSGKTRVLSLHWTQHPVKARGLTRIVNANGVLGWTSPWYEGEVARRSSKQEIAQEIDIDYLGSGDMFFDSDVLGRVRATQIIEPVRKGEITYSTTTKVLGRSYAVSGATWASSDGGRVKLWGEIVPDTHDRPRLSQQNSYAAFCDISFGTGASNSSLEVICCETGEQVLELAVSQVSPEQFARDVIAVCQWIGGENGEPLLGWERNGPGEIFSREVWRFGYKRVLGNMDTSLTWEPTDSHIGWHSNREKKLRLFGDLRADMARGEVTVRSAALLGELETTTYYPTGGVGPSQLQGEAEGARSAHGDRVVSFAGAQMVRKHSGSVKFDEPEAPEGSFEWRYQQRQKERINREAGSKW